MKQKNVDTNNHHGSGGCLGWAVVIIILIAIGCMSCATSKQPCGDYDKWNEKTKFRSK